ncbi:MAG: FAD-dependent oxidoreductase [Mycobacteriaceae bacterium]
MSAHKVVIVGYGMAGARLQDELYRYDPAGEKVATVVYGKEPWPAYNRIQLSNVVAGQLKARDTRLKPDNWCERHGLIAKTNVTVDLIDRARKAVHCSDGSVESYDTLVLATGSDAFIPTIPGAFAEDGSLSPGLIPFRTLDDCTDILSRINEGSRVVVLGGGLLGLEAARGALLRGAEVTVVHPKDFPMDRQLDASGGAVLVRTLRELGMTILLGVRASEFGPEVVGARKVVLTDGSELIADLVIITAGIRPSINLAVEAGLEVDEAICVDDSLITSDENIRAIGDCAQHQGVVYGLVQPAWEMADIVAEQIFSAACGLDSQKSYRGTNQVTRLKAHGIDLAAMGNVEPDIADTQSEVLSLADSTRGRYAKVVIRNDRVIGAVLLANSEVVGLVSQLFDTGAPVPTDRMSLLLGHITGGATQSASPAGLPGSAVICRCNSVTKKQLIQCWHEGARTTKELAETTRATTGCGGCVDAIEGLCAWLEKADPQDTKESGDEVA